MSESAAQQSAEGGATAASAAASSYLAKRDEALAAWRARLHAAELARADGATATKPSRDAVYTLSSRSPSTTPRRTCVLRRRESNLPLPTHSTRDAWRTRAHTASHHTQAWIVVDDIVYDMTPHLLEHQGWHGGAAKVSTLIALLGAMGQDVTDDFNEARAHTV